MKKTALIILDGWGHGKHESSNAVFSAKTPHIDALYKNSLCAELDTDGENVGLPKGQMGNSEVGHLTIGSGRIIHQDLTKINQEIKTGLLSKNPFLLEAINKAIKNNKPIHIMGLLSDGGIHSHSNHLQALCDAIIEKNVQHIYVHAFTDGRDTDPKSGKKHIANLLNYAKDKNITIATIMGRYYAMDRDKRWERTTLAYNLLTRGEGIQTSDLLSSIQQSYDNNISDEFILPIVNTDSNNNPIAKIKDGDTVICFNFRSDRCRQIVTALTQVDIPQYHTNSIDIELYTMTNYDDTFEHINILYPKEHVKNTLGEVLSKSGKSQLRIAETEKYPHVTFFFSGGMEEKFKNEKRILTPSPKVATYDLQPEMSAHEVTTACVKEIQKNKPDFICLNYANPDMVGHTGDIHAVKKAVETIDKCIEAIITTCKQEDYALVIIADHGNAELMINKDGSPNTAHTTNKVPCFILNTNYKSIKNGGLADIAPTILSIMGIDKPNEMTGKSIID